MIIGNIIGTYDIFSSGTPENVLSKLAIRFNTTPHSYLTTSASWTDTGTLSSNVISITTIVADETGSGGLNSNTGLIINEGISDTPGDDLIGSVIGDPDQIRFFKRSSIPEGASTSIPTIDSSLSAAGMGQGIGSDPENQYVLGDGGTTVRIINYSDALIEALPITNANPGQFYYNYATGDLFITSDTNTQIRRFQRSGGEWTLVETYWYRSSEGGALCKIYNRFVSSSGQNIREQELSGFKTITWKPPFASAENEGLVVDQRDGTFWKNSDDYFHGSIVNGNRLIHLDPRGVYKQYLRFPDMIRYSEDFNVGGSISGLFGDEQLTGDDWNISPVINFKAYTGQQSLANYTYEGAELEFRGSGTAPSTTGRDYNPVADVDVYDANQANDGWGSTTPSAWQSTPTTDQYMQFRVKPIAVEPPAFEWSPEQISKTLWCESRAFTDDWGLDVFDMYVDYADEPVAGEFRTQTMINKADPTNNFTVGTTSSSPRYVVSSDLLEFRSASTLHYVLASNTNVLNKSSTDIHVIGRRTATTNTAIFFTAHNTANSNDRIILAWLPSSHATAPNAICIIYNNASGSISYYGVASTRTDLPLITFRLGDPSGANKIFIDGVEQTLTTYAGSNTGQCFDDLTTANTVRIARIQGGTATPLTVRDSNHVQSFLLMCPIADTNFSNLLTYTSNLGLR